MIVMKFGGTSVASSARIRAVAAIVRKKQKEDRQLAVVFSAFGGVTDDLIHMSRLASVQDMEYKKVFDKIRLRHFRTAAELGLSANRPLNFFLDTCFDNLHDIVHGVYLVAELSLRTL